MVNYLFIPIYQEYEILFLQPYFFVGCGTGNLEK